MTRLRDTTRPLPSAPWAWKTRFAMSNPIVLACPTGASSVAGQRCHFGTPGNQDDRHPHERRRGQAERRAGDPRAALEPARSEYIVVRRGRVRGRARHPRLFLARGAGSRSYHGPRQCYVAAMQDKATGRLFCQLHLVRP